MSVPAELSAKNHEVIAPVELDRSNDIKMEFVTEDGLKIEIQLRNAQMGDPTLFFMESAGHSLKFEIFPTQSVKINDAEVGFDAVAYADYPGTLIVLDRVTSAARYRRSRVRPFAIKEMSVAV